MTHDRQDTAWLMSEMGVQGLTLSCGSSLRLTQEHRVWCCESVLPCQRRTVRAQGSRNGGVLGMFGRVSTALLTAGRTYTRRRLFSLTQGALAPCYLKILPSFSSKVLELNGLTM
jgi:hypothetical protein